MVNNTNMKEMTMQNNQEFNYFPEIVSFIKANKHKFKDLEIEKIISILEVELFERTSTQSDGYVNDENNIPGSQL